MSKGVLRLECELGILETEWNALLVSDNLDLDKMRDLTNQIDDTYDELLDAYQEQLDEVLVDIYLDDEERHMIATKTVERMAEICAIMFQ